MKINLDEDLNSWENNSVKVANSNSELNTSNKGYLKFMLNNLPKPSNNYEIDIMDSVEPLKEEEQDKNEIIEDEEERIIKFKEEKANKERIEFLNQTQAVQRKLVRPVEVNEHYSELSQQHLNNNLKIEELSKYYIKSEMNRLIKNDSLNYPMKGIKVTINLISSR